MPAPKPRSVQGPARTEGAASPERLNVNSPGSRRAAPKHSEGGGTSEPGDQDRPGTQPRMGLNPRDRIDATVRPLRGRGPCDLLNPRLHRGLFMFKPSGLAQADHSSKASCVRGQDDHDRQHPS